MTRIGDRIKFRICVGVVAVAVCCAATAAQSTRPVAAGSTVGTTAGSTTASTYDDTAIGEVVEPRADAPSDIAAPTVAPNSIGFDLGRLAIALAIVLALIFGARWLFTHFFAGARAPATSRAVRVLGRTSLAPRQQVLLLQVGRRVVVVGESNGNLATLAQLDDPDEVAALVGQLQEEQMQRAASFGGLFGRVQKKYADDEHAPRDLSDLQGAPAEPATPGASSGASPGDDADAARMKSELSGLVEKMRSIRNQLGS